MLHNVNQDVHHKANTKQDGQCKYNVTSRRIRATNVVMERQWVLHSLSVCICSLRCPTTTAHAPYCHLWPAPLYNIFPHDLINGTIFEKKVIEHNMCVLIFSTILMWNISHSQKNKWDMIKKCILVFMYSTFYSCPILMKLEFSQQNFEKSSNTKFHKNPSSESRVVPCRETERRTDGQTDGKDDGHDEANSCCSQFCERAQKRGIQCLLVAGHARFQNVAIVTSFSGWISCSTAELLIFFLY